MKTLTEFVNGIRLMNYICGVVNRYNGIICNTRHIDKIAGVLDKSQDLKIKYSLISIDVVESVTLSCDEPASSD